MKYIGIDLAIEGSDHTAIFAWDGTTLYTVHSWWIFNILRGL